MGVYSICIVHPMQNATHSLPLVTQGNQFHHKCKRKVLINACPFFEVSLNFNLFILINCHSHMPHNISKQLFSWRKEFVIEFFFTSTKGIILPYQFACFYYGVHFGGFDYTYLI